MSAVEEFDAAELVDDDRPLADLGLVQLAARLGATIEKRKALVAAQPLPIAPVALAPSVAAVDFEAAEADEAARAIADYFGALPSPDPEPAVIQPELVAEIPFARLPRSTQRSSTRTTKTSSPTSEGFDEGEYSSLFELNNPFVRQPEFIRVEEPQADSDAVEPTVEFPSAADAQTADNAEDEPADRSTRLFDPPKNPDRFAAQSTVPAAPRDPGDAERNLRAALATLQRMGGAA